MPDQINPNAAPTNEASMTKPEAASDKQEIFDMFIINGMELIYDEKQAKSMLPRIADSEDPVKAMAELLVDIVTRITRSAQQAGKKIPPEVVLHGGNFLFAEMLKVFEAAGMAPLTEEQKTAVWQMASSIYINQAVQSGEITEQELMALSQQVEQTKAGKKVMKTASDPEAAIKKINKPAIEDTVVPTVEAAPAAMPTEAPMAAPMAAPNQGGM
ncbi:MAG: hypothetical protein GY845_03425 [Planctomycetes bacterium]|nr:hypothetical protein [Planctomycetota bacterium]